MTQKPKSNISLILKGYGKFTAIVMKTALLLGAAAGINIILLYPLWYTAIHHRKTYTAIAGIAICTAVLFFIIRSIKKRIELERARGKSPAAFFLKPVITTLKTGAVLLIIYLFALLFFRGYSILAAAGFILFLLSAGLLLFTGNSGSE